MYDYRLKLIIFIYINIMRDFVMGKFVSYFIVLIANLKSLSGFDLLLHDRSITVH